MMFRPALLIAVAATASASPTLATAAEMRTGIVWHALPAHVWQGPIPDREAAPALSLELAFGDAPASGQVELRPYFGGRISTEGAALA
jgi:hypothetical protein